MRVPAIMNEDEYEEYKSIVNSMREINERSKDYILLLELKEKIEEYETRFKTGD